MRVDASVPVCLLDGVDPTFLRSSQELTRLLVITRLIYCGSTKRCKCRPTQLSNAESGKIARLYASKIIEASNSTFPRSATT